MMTRKKEEHLPMNLRNRLFNFMLPESLEVKLSKSMIWHHLLSLLLSSWFRTLTLENVHMPRTPPKKETDYTSLFPSWLWQHT